MDLVVVKCTTVERNDKTVVGNFEKLVVEKDKIVIYITENMIVELPYDMIIIENPVLSCDEYEEDDEE